MSRYDNIECPVCKNLFEEGDDIVVCPDCGTPHHRKCYNNIGHCVNRGLHKSGYSFDEDSGGVSSDIVKAAKELIEQNEQKNAVDGEKKPSFSPIGIQITPDFGSMYEGDTDTIDGESVSDVASVVRSNIPRFIRVFKRLESKKSRLSWNWGAFIFGSFYFFYRKIYRQAISLISLGLTLLLGFNFALSKLAPVTTGLFEEYAKLASQNNVSQAKELAQKIMTASDYNTATTVYVVFIGAFFALRLLEALFADRMYKTTVTSLIKRVQRQIDEGATLSSPMGEESAVRLSQEQMKRYYLASKGGVNLFAPMIALLAVQMLLRVI